MFWAAHGLHWCVSVLISLISGTCYMVTNEINCIVWATSMDQAPGLLALQDRGPGFALLPGAARRSAPPLTKKKESYQKKGKFPKKKKSSCSCFFFFSLTVVRFLEQRYFTSLLPCRCGHTHWRFGASVPICRNWKPGYSLSTSFEKTCMRQFHTFPWMMWLTLI